MAEKKCEVCSRGVLEDDELYKVVRDIRVDGSAHPKMVKACYKCATNADSCNQCNTRYTETAWNSWQVRVGSSIVCRASNCFDRYFWTCACSGNEKFVSRNSICNYCKRDKDGNRLRCECGNGSEDRPVHNYSCQPHLQFHDIGGVFDEESKPKKMWMGFELEIQIPGSNVNEAAKFVRAQLQTTEIAQSKSDGSIGGGIELVTQPHTYEKYRDQPLLWDTIGKVRDVYNGRSWDPGTCGFHIHLGRDGFKDKAHLHRFVELVYRNSEMMMKFGGRRSTYSKFDDCWDFDEWDRPVFSLANKMNRDSQGGEKYTAVNTSKPATVEMRFMRGTTKKESILAYLGMADAIAKYTRDIAAEGNWYDWETFANWVTNRQGDYPELYERMPSIKDLKIKDLDVLKIKA